MAATRRKVRAVGAVRLDGWKIISRALEEGITYGLNRAFKHTDTPSREVLAEQIELAVMNAVSEVVAEDY